MTDIDEHFPTSRSVERVRYETASMELEVAFKTGGTYIYFRVPRDEVDALLVAESKGRHVAKQIKPKYACKKV